jgi:hypothetical protein
MSSVVFGEALVDEFNRPSRWSAARPSTWRATWPPSWRRADDHPHRQRPQRPGRARRVRALRDARRRPAARPDGRNRPRAGRAHRAGHRFTDPAAPGLRLHRSGTRRRQLRVDGRHRSTSAPWPSARNARARPWTPCWRPPRRCATSTSTCARPVRRSHRHALAEAADIAKVNEEELQALFQWYFQIGPNDAPLGVEEVHAACRALSTVFAADPDRDPGPPRLGVFGADGGMVATATTRRRPS